MAALQGFRMGFNSIEFRGILAALLMLGASAVAGQPRMIMESPRGGEYYVEGQTQQIRVKTRVKKVRVELSRDGGVTYAPQPDFGKIIRIPYAISSNV